MKILTEVQEMSGCAPPQLTPNSKPIGDLEGFDSLSSIEATVLIESALGINAGCESLFISDDGQNALTLDEILQRVSSLANLQGLTV
jgi:acyl carrier protein